MGESGFRPPRFMTVAEVAEVTRVSRMTVYRMVHAGDLPAVRVGRSFRVPEAAVKRLLEQVLDGEVTSDLDARQDFGEERASG
jgi:excisionase family DNA binding protein